MSTTLDFRASCVASHFERPHAGPSALESLHIKSGRFSVNSTPVAVPVYERFGFRVTGARVEMNGIACVPMRLQEPAGTACFAFRP